MSQEEVKKEENKMEIIKEPDNIEPTAGKKRRQEEEILARDKKENKIVEEDLMLTAIPLSQSIWAPSRRPCSNTGNYKANILAYNVPGENKEQRIRMVKGMLAGNNHVKEVKEVFKNYNKWIEVTFD
ncbi:10395_t:CDS:2, partial [Ambispora leptoticha]